MTAPKLWSARQWSAAGLNRRFYPPHLRDLVDFDYADRLSEEERTWLAVFTEEFYRGWRLKSEQQLHPPEQIREANAAAKRSRISAVCRLAAETSGEACQPPPSPPGEAEIVARIDAAADWWPATPSSPAPAAPARRPRRRRNT